MLCSVLNASRITVTVLDPLERSLKFKSRASGKVLRKQTLGVSRVSPQRKATVLHKGQFREKRDTEGLHFSPLVGSAYSYDLDVSALLI